VGRRRANGEGTITRRRNGTWQAAVTLTDGRRKFYYGKTKEEVRQKLSEGVRSRDAGTFADARSMTVGDFLDHWISEVVKASVRRWTYMGYEVHVRRHLKPTLGGIRLERLTPMHVQAMMNKKLLDGLSPKSVRYIRGTLRTALNQAHRWGLVSQNAAALVDVPRVQRFAIRPFTPDEARLFLAAVHGDRLEALYSVALTMGLRQAEALGLTWQDVDLELGTLRVSRQLQRIDGRFELVEPKTERSSRFLALPASVAKALREHGRRQEAERKAAGERWQGRDLVFTMPDGRPIHGRTLLRQFHEHLTRAGLSSRRFHDLRHSCATLLLVQGVSPRVVMDTLGHSDISMTMNTYSHVIPELRREAATRIDELLMENDR
jgi:integrase